MVTCSRTSSELTRLPGGIDRATGPAVTAAAAVLRLRAHEVHVGTVGVHHRESVLKRLPVFVGKPIRVEARAALEDDQSAVRRVLHTVTKRNPAAGKTYVKSEILKWLQPLSKYLPLYNGLFHSFTASRNVLPPFLNTAPSISLENYRSFTRLLFIKFIIAA